VSAPAQRRGRLLIVDDQPDILEGMKALMELEGLDVTTHDSMITLPFIVREADPDVILLDISLPALSGTALFRMGSKRLLRTDASIILFSGRSPQELQRLTKEYGAHGFVSKSEDSMAIIARVQTWIAERRAIRITKAPEAANVQIRTASPAVQ
jgi:two-component system alkaline phosphatase synthesis response regulator PhoP